MRARTIRQVVRFAAPPAAVYRALMTSRGHSAFSGSTCRISGRVGGSFSAWDGYIHGTNVELVPGRTIVQQWTAAEDDWPEGHESRVRFRLIPEGKGTRLEFTHSHVPPALAAQFAQGWKEFYWAPLRKYLDGGGD